jgi:hypothetical protein
MPKYMPSRSDLKQGLSMGKKGRPRTRFAKEEDPAVSAGLTMAPRPPMRMKKGGSASSRADGIAMKGKTKGRFV